MQKKIIHVWVLLQLIFLGMNACTTPEVNQGLEGKWHLVGYETLDGSWVQTEPDHIARAVWVDFSVNGRRGRFEGQTVTIPIMGLYRLPDAETIEVYEIAGSLRGEPEWGDRFWPAMATANSFQRDGDVMRIMYADSSKQMIFNLVND